MEPPISAPQAEPMRPIPPPKAVAALRASSDFKSKSSSMTRSTHWLHTRYFCICLWRLRNSPPVHCPTLQGASTRLLVHAAKLMARGIAPRTACSGAIAEALSDDPEMLRAINELASSLF